MLALIQRQDSYGYELVEDLRANNLPAVREGSIYPLLRRLESQGLIESYLQSSTGEPARKYYRITPEGKETLHNKALRSFEVYETTRKIVTARVDLDNDGDGKSQLRCANVREDQEVNDVEEASEVQADEG